MGDVRVARRAQRFTGPLSTRLPDSNGTSPITPSSKGVTSGARNFLKFPTGRIGGPIKLPPQPMRPRSPAFPSSPLPSRGLCPKTGTDPLPEGQTSFPATTGQGSVPFFGPRERGEGGPGRRRRLLKFRVLPSLTHRINGPGPLTRSVSEGPERVAGVGVFAAPSFRQSWGRTADGSTPATRQELARSSRAMRCSRSMACFKVCDWTGTARHEQNR